MEVRQPLKEKNRNFKIVKLEEFVEHIERCKRIKKEYNEIVVIDYKK